MEEVQPESRMKTITTHSIWVATIESNTSNPVPCGTVVLTHDALSDTALLIRSEGSVRKITGFSTITFTVIWVAA